MTPTCLADELAMIRAELVRLRTREAELRRALIAAAPAQRLGRWHGAEVSPGKRMVFNPWLLPARLRQNPRYWQERGTLLVTLLPLQPQTKLRPGWPIRRDPSVVALH